MRTKASSTEAPSLSDAPVTLEGILDPDRVLCDIRARSKKHALDLLSETLSSGEQRLHKLEIFDCLVSRERLGSTAIGCAVAIPHARVNTLSDLRAAFVRLAEPVAFDAADGKPVRFLFGLLVPDGDEEKHLRLLSTIAQMLARDLFRKSLDEARDADELYNILISFEPTAKFTDDAPDHS
ncbi:MAG: PTS sugar transporter subunit IIA [Gammaproteobacteria bacterium]|nr:PTS sugar transporter subunit IIA [Gammaproteobacteria bacterium]